VQIAARCRVRARPLASGFIASEFNSFLQKKIYMFVVLQCEFTVRTRVEATGMSVKRQDRTGQDGTGRDGTGQDGSPVFVRWRSSSLQFNSRIPPRLLSCFTRSVAVIDFPPAFPCPYSQQHEVGVAVIWNYPLPIMRTPLKAGTLTLLHRFLFPVASVCSRPRAHILSFLLTLSQEIFVFCVNNTGPSIHTTH
jgi:hypothetical protein